MHIQTDVQRAIFSMLASVVKIAAVRLRPTGAALAAMLTRVEYTTPGQPYLTESHTA